MGLLRKRFADAPNTGAVEIPARASAAAPSGRGAGWRKASSRAAKGRYSGSLRGVQCGGRNGQGDQLKMLGLPVLKGLEGSSAHCYAVHLLWTLPLLDGYSLLALFLCKSAQAWWRPHWEPLWFREIVDEHRPGRKDNPFYVSGHTSLSLAPHSRDRSTQNQGAEAQSDISVPHEFISTLFTASRQTTSFAFVSGAN